MILAIIGASLFLPPQRTFFRDRPFVPGGHTVMSLDMAVNARYCARLGYISHSRSLTQALGADARLLRRPIPQLLVHLAGSREAYCATVTVPYLNNENSLMLAVTAVLWLAPNVTPHGLEEVLSAVRLSLILLFAHSLIEAGAGLPLVVGFLLASISLTRELWTFSLSMYIFFVPLLLGACGAYLIAVRHLSRRSLWGLVLLGILAGFASAFGSSMRSSHLPVYIALFAAAVWAARRNSGRSTRPWQYAAVAVLCFAIGYAAFGRLFIRPLVAVMPPESRQFSYHVIGHPLVLGLAFPESDLSRREGIRWDDAVGSVLAQRMIPEAAYLGRHYEEAMLLYYLKLWLLYPGEIIDIYQAKLRLAGTGMFAAGPAARAAAAIWQPSSGGAIVGVYVLAVAVGLAVYRRKAYPVALSTALMSIVAVLLFLESMLIVPYYHVQYHGFLFVTWVYLMLLAAQLAADAVVGWAMRRRIRSTLAPQEAA